MSDQMPEKDAPPPAAITVNQVNVGDLPALEAAKHIAIHLWRSDRR
jgi:hypothetical protein